MWQKQSNLYLMVATITLQLKPLPTSHWYSFLSKQTGCIFTGEHVVLDRYVMAKKDISLKQTS